MIYNITNKTECQPFWFTFNLDTYLLTRKLISKSNETANSDAASPGWGELLDELKDKEGIVSDLKLADSLGISRAFISSIRRFKKKMPIELGEEILIRLDRKLTMKEILMFVPLSMRRRTIIRFMPDLANNKANIRAKFKCELCGQAVPFILPGDTSFLETYHLTYTQREDKDPIANTVALCPNCHRKMDLNPSEDDKQFLIDLIAKRSNE